MYNDNDLNENFCLFVCFVVVVVVVFVVLFCFDETREIHIVWVFFHAVATIR